MADRPGVVYLRTTRGAYPVLYPPGGAFPIGGAKVLRSSPTDRVALLGAGVTVHNCLAAAAELASDGIPARVVDVYSVKPIDVGTLTRAAAVTDGRLVIAGDQYRQGGLGSAVLEALTGAGRTELALAHLAVDELPGSGTGEQLLDAIGISAAAIARAARRLIDQGDGAVDA